MVIYDNAIGKLFIFKVFSEINFNYIL